MTRPECKTGYSKGRSHKGGGSSLVAINKRMIFDDAVSISTCLGFVSWIELCAAERLERLRKRRLQKPLVSHTVDSAELSNN